MRITARLLFLAILAAVASVAQPIGGGGAAAIQCVGTPGNTPGTYRQQCQTSPAGAIYACNNSSGCAVSADWVAVGGATAGAVVASYNTAAGTCSLTSGTGSCTASSTCGTASAPCIAITHTLNDKYLFAAAWDNATPPQMLGGATATTKVNGIAGTSTSVTTITLLADAIGVAKVSTGGQGPAGTNGSNGAGYLGQSSTSQTTGPGSITITASAGLALQVGNCIQVVSSGTPGDQMIGPVTAYNSSTGVLTFTSSALSGATCSGTTGTGTHTDWNVGLIGIAGAQGPAGAGSINSGTTGQTAYYAGAGNTLSPVGPGSSGQIYQSAGASAPVFVDFPDVKSVPAANCNNVTAGAGWSIGSGGTASCRAGTNNTLGYITITDTSTTFAEFAMPIPGDWNSANLPYIKFGIASTDVTNGHTIIPQIRVGCVTVTNGTASDDPTLAAAHSSATITVGASAAANGFYTSSMQTNSTDMAGCVAGGMMFVQVGRATDTATSANFYYANVTWPRRLIVQGN